MLTGKADVLSSKFHLGYNMLLNCVRVETVDVEMLIQKSFYTFQQQKALPELKARHAQLLSELAAPARASISPIGSRQGTTWSVKSCISLRARR